MKNVIHLVSGGINIYRGYQTHKIENYLVRMNIYKFQNQNSFKSQDKKDINAGNKTQMKLLYSTVNGRGKLQN